MNGLDVLLLQQALTWRRWGRSDAGPNGATLRLAMQT